MKRCSLIRAGLLLATWLFAQVTAAHAGEIPQGVEKINQDVWKRFVYSNGLVLDYAPSAGEVDIPTAEESGAGKPNAISWWTPVENGAFFTGLYLDAMVKRAGITGAEADKEKARRLSRGLLACAAVGDTPGFVARFVLSDGKSCYALGSDDQTAPWFYGLWSYVRSDIPTADEKAGIVAKMEAVASALKVLRWALPCAPIGDIPPGAFRGGFGDPDFRNASRLLFITRALYELTGSEEWNAEYRRVLEEKPRGGEKSRLDLIAAGMEGDFAEKPMLAKQHFWIFISSQAMLRELVTLESDDEIRAVYRKTLRENANIAARELEGADPQDDWGDPPYPADWRVLNELWRPQASSQEATDLAMEQYKIWNRGGRPLENKLLREPLGAAWIVAFEPGAIGDLKKADNPLARLIQGTNWDGVTSSFGFFAEGAWYQAQDAAAKDLFN